MTRDKKMAFKYIFKEEEKKIGPKMYRDLYLLHLLAYKMSYQIQ